MTDYRPTSADMVTWNRVERAIERQTSLELRSAIKGVNPLSVKEARALAMTRIQAECVGWSNGKI